MKVIERLPGAGKLKKEIELSEAAARHKRAADAEIAAIIRGDSDRFMLIVGPCSADDPGAMMEYADRLARISKAVRERICIVLRVFTAKPRSSTSGYMGLVHEPNGISAARGLHVDVLTQTGLLTADELLYPAVLPYFDDLVSYFAIGARSVENQEHRLVASGLANAVGMKNPTSGDLQSLVNAVAAAKAPHDYIFCSSWVQSQGNPLAHGILRGGATSNYHMENLLDAHILGLRSVIVDTNHGNSGKNHGRQPNIAINVLESRRQSDVVHKLVKGLMIESYIADGAATRGQQAFGQSITDPCLGIEATEKLIYEIADRV